MSYDANERGHGRPLELYEFGRQHVRWRYTSAAHEVTAGALVYTPVQIEHAGLSASRELARQAIAITVARDNPVAELYRVAPPSDVVTCVIRQVHEGSTEVVALWSGRIVGVDWSGLRAELSLEPVYTSVRRMGLRRRYQRACPFALYGPGCGVVRTAHELVSTAGSISGLTVHVAGANAFGDGWYSGGYLEWDSAGGLFERRMIARQVATNVELTAAPHGLAVGQAVRLYPGCDRTLATCHSKFANSANYGGMPYIPLRNPFGGLNPLF
jgi:uncharacterized phage protein (TIGR02218 family)